MIPLSKAAGQIRSVRAIGLVMAATGAALACLGGLAGLGAFILKKTGAAGFSPAEIAAISPALAFSLAYPGFLALAPVAAGGILFWAGMEFIRFKPWARLVLEIANLLSLAVPFACASFFAGLIPALPGSTGLILRILIWLAAAILAVPTLGLAWYFRRRQLRAEFARKGRMEDHTPRSY